MMRHRSPSNQTTVPVLDRHGVPLAPTRPSRARLWLETGRATKVWRGGHFAVQRHDLDSAECEVLAVSLRIDPGYRNTGMVVALSLPDGSVQVVAGYVVQHRTNRIVESMTHRSVMRRGRLRRRPARFDNRIRPADWLAPSMRSCVSNIATTVKRLMALYPVGALHVETTIFDPRLLHDPLVEGTGYQTSERGNMQVREYVLQRDRRTCQYCGAARGRLEVDHVVPKSRGGGYRIDNLVASCRRCNAGKGSQSVGGGVPGQRPAAVGSHLGSAQDEPAGRHPHELPDGAVAQGAVRYRPAVGGARRHRHGLYPATAGYSQVARQRCRVFGRPAGGAEHPGACHAHQGSGARTAADAVASGQAWVTPAPERQRWPEQPIPPLLPFVAGSAGVCDHAGTSFAATAGARHYQRRSGEVPASQAWSRPGIRRAGQRQHQGGGVGWGIGESAAVHALGPGQRIPPRGCAELPIPAIQGGQMTLNQARCPQMQHAVPERDSWQGNRV